MRSKVEKAGARKAKNKKKKEEEERTAIRSLNKKRHTSGSCDIVIKYKSQKDLKRI